MTAPELTATLRRATAALDEADPLSAASVLESAVTACEESLRAGLRLDRDDMSELRGLHARCTAAAERCQALLAQAIGAAGSARRALSAYQR